MIYRGSDHEENILLFSICPPAALPQLLVIYGFSWWTDSLLVAKVTATVTWIAQSAIHQPTPLVPCRLLERSSQLIELLASQVSELTN